MEDIWHSPDSPVTGDKWLVDYNRNAASIWEADPKRLERYDPTKRELYNFTRRVSLFTLDAASDLLDDEKVLENPLTFRREHVPAEHGLLTWSVPGAFFGFAWDVVDDSLEILFLTNEPGRRNIPIILDFEGEPSEYRSNRDLTSDEQRVSSQLRAVAFTAFYFIHNPEIVSSKPTGIRVAPKGGSARYRQQSKASNVWLSADGKTVVKTITLAPGNVESEGTASGGSGGGRVRYMFPVRGHWRNQWYPTLQTHIPVYIHPFFKGVATGRTATEVNRL